MFDCPQCGHETSILQEGYCADCCVQNQSELDQFNAQYDAWQKMNDRERSVAISAALRLC